MSGTPVAPTPDPIRIELEFLFELVDEGFCIVEVLFDDAGEATDYRFLRTNPAFIAETGLEDAVGRTARELLPALEPHWFELYGYVARTGEPIRFAAPSAEMGRAFDVHAFRLDAPELRRVGILFTDVTRAAAAERERERLLAELRLERARLAAVFAQAPSVLAIVRGPDYVIEMANQAYLALNGHRDLIGKPLFEVVPELRGQGFEQLLDGVVETGIPYVGREVPIWLSRTQGAALEERFFDFVYLPLVEADDEGAPVRVGVIAHGTDITEQVSARRDAEAARTEAEAANRAKSEFLAVMSHELRTPLNAIGGYAELMEMGIRGPVTAQQREDLARIQWSQRHLLGLINEVLNYAKLETGAVSYSLESVHVAEVVAETEGLVAPQARAKGLALDVGECGRNLRVLADREKLRQVLVNLLSNAVKFTDEGGRVELTCEHAERDVRILVRDTGIGIPADRLESIFEPFVQVRNDLTRTADGTGLGLAISRDLAVGMGGDLTVESTLGKGSTFTLALPRA